MLEGNNTTRLEQISQTV